MEHEFIFIWAIIVTIALGIIIVFLMNLRKKHYLDIQEVNKKLEQAQTNLEKKQTKSFQIGVV